MGILNVTPDSFSDGGRYEQLDRALDRAWEMVDEGAAILDVGGESTRPGAIAVSIEEEIKRVVPVVNRLAAKLPIPLSVDTRHTEVMRRALEEGASMINDVNALRDEGAIEVVAENDAAVCLMHMKGDPRTMQKAPEYKNVVDEVENFLLERAELCEQSGIAADRIALDPGFGFGKKVKHNLRLMRSLPRLTAMGYPILVGVSRKSFIGELMGGVPAEARLQGSVAAALYAAQSGARLIRVHDVRATREALDVFWALSFGLENE